LLASAKSDTQFSFFTPPCRKDTNRWMRCDASLKNRAATTTPGEISKRN
jgi:hypothetical protein